MQIQRCRSTALQGLMQIGQQRLMRIRRTMGLCNHELHELMQIRHFDSSCNWSSVAKVQMVQVLTGTMQIMRCKAPR